MIYVNVQFIFFLNIASNPIKAKLKDNKEKQPFNLNKYLINNIIKILEYLPIINIFMKRLLKQCLTCHCRVDYSKRGIFPLTSKISYIKQLK